MLGSSAWLLVARVVGGEAPGTVWRETAGAPALAASSARSARASRAQGDALHAGARAAARPTRPGARPRSVLLAGGLRTPMIIVIIILSISISIIFMFIIFTSIGIIIVRRFVIVIIVSLLSNCLCVIFYIV